MAGFLMGLAKGATPRATTGGKTMRSLADELTLQGAKAKDAERLKRTIDRTNAFTAKETGIQARKTVERTEEVQSKRLIAQNKMQHLTGPVAVKAQEGRDKIALKRTVDETLLAKTNQENEYKDAEVSFSMYNKRMVENNSKFGRNWQTKPTFDEVLKIYKGNPNTEGFKVFLHNRFLARKATPKEIKNGLANTSGFIMGKGGPNGGFATLGSREIIDDATAQYTSDHKHLKVVMDGMSGTNRDSEKHGFFFKETDAGSYEIDKVNSSPGAIATYNRIESFIHPNVSKSTNPLEIAALSVKMYIANRVNKENFIANGGKRLPPKQIRRNVEKELIAPTQSFISAEKTVGLVENILIAKAQFAAGPGSTRYKKAIESIDKDDTLYMSVLNRAMLVFENPAKFNRYEGAVNFVQETDSFAKQLKHKDGRIIGKVGPHIVGYAKAHKANSTDAYLNNITEVIKPTSREYDMIVTTALGEAEGLASQDIENIDHVLEVIRNRLYHPDFKKQREVSKIVKAPPKRKAFVEKKGTLEASTDGSDGKTLAEVGEILAKGNSKGERIKLLIPKLTKSTSHLDLPSTPERVNEIISAAKNLASYDDISNNKNLSKEQKAIKIVEVNNVRYSNNIAFKEAQSIAPVRERERLKTSIPVELSLSGTGGLSTRTASGYAWPRVMTVAASEKQLLTLINQGRKVELKSLKDRHSSSIANLGRWETWVGLVKNSNIKKGEKERILDAWQKQAGPQILSNLRDLASVTTLGPYTRVNLEPKNLPNIADISFKLGGKEISAGKIIEENFIRLSKYVKFHSQGGVGGTGNYVYVEKEIKGGEDGDASLTLVIAKSKRDPEDVRRNGYFEVPQRKIPNEKGSMVPLSSGTMNPQDNKWIRALDPAGKFSLPNDPKREARVNELLEPFKQALREYKTDRSTKTTLTLAKSLKSMLQDNGSELKGLLGEHYNDFKKGDLIMAAASVMNVAFHSEKVRMDGETSSVGGVQGIPTSEENPVFRLRTEKEKNADKDVTEAKKVRNSAVTVIRYMQGLLNTFIGLGSRKIQANILAGALSRDNLPEENLAVAKTFLTELRGDANKLENLLKAFKPEEAARITKLLGEAGAERTGSISGVLDWLIGKSKQIGALADDLLGVETGHMTKSKRLFDMSTKYMPADINAKNIADEGRIQELGERSAWAKDEYKKALKMAPGRDKTDRILAARRNFYAIALTYHFAGLVQGGSGGRAISNEDFENLYDALFSNEGDVQYSGIKRALSISQNALYRSEIILNTQGRIGQAEYVLEGVRPLMDAINTLEERETIAIEAQISSNTVGQQGIRASQKILSTFVSSTDKGEPSNLGIEQQAKIHNTMDRLPFGEMKPIQFQILASKAGIDINNIKLINSEDFYKLIDTLGGLEVAEAANASNTTSYIEAAQRDGSSSRQFNNGIKNMLKNMDRMTYNPVVSEKKGMNASGKTMYEIFQMAEAEGDNEHKEDYKRIKREFLTAYVRTYVDRIMQGSAHPLRTLEEGPF